MPVSALVEKSQIQRHLDGITRDDQASASRASNPEHVQHQSDSADNTEGDVREFQTPIRESLTPPPYSGPSSTSQVNVSRPANEPRGPQKHPGLPRLDYRLYSPPLFELSSDATVIKSTAPYLSTNVPALVSLIRAQVSASRFLGLKA
jgi:hypothetical protein